MGKPLQVLRQQQSSGSAFEKAQSKWGENPHIQTGLPLPLHDQPEVANIITRVGIRAVKNQLLFGAILQYLLAALAIAGILGFFGVKIANIELNNPPDIRELKR